jgi:hypothetical protein
MPSLLRIASASRSGSPGISGPWVPGRRFGVAEDVNPFVDLFFDLSLSIKPSMWRAPKKWPMPIGQ